MFQDARDFQTGLVATLRADLHNTSSRQYKRQYEPKDFLPGAVDAIEERVAELVAKGMSPAAAAAIACSKQTKEEQLGALNSLNGPQAAGRGKRSKKG